MGRGRTRTVTDPTAPLIPGERPPPPPELNPAQQAIWGSITARLPQGWFVGENMPLLKELCRHIDYADDLAADIKRARASPGDSKDLLMLLRAHGYQTERIGNLSTKLKLTQRSRYTRDGEAAAIASRSGSAVKPWLDWQNDQSGQKKQ